MQNEKSKKEGTVSRWELYGPARFSTLHFAFCILHFSSAR
jgi:hypothetical protein